jgi:hypothetical protein
VAAVAGRRAGPSVAARAEVVAPLDRCALALVEPRGTGVERPAEPVGEGPPPGRRGRRPPARASACPPARPTMTAGREILPSQLCRRGIGPPCSKVLLGSAKSATQQRMIESPRPRSVATTVPRCGVAAGGPRETMVASRRSAPPGPSGVIGGLILGPSPADGSSSRRSRPAKGEAPAMAQTNQAWDWGVELRDDERSELELLRGTVAQLSGQLEQAHDSLRVTRQREQDARQALRQLDQAGPWRRRRVRTALRNRQLL